MGFFSIETLIKFLERKANPEPCIVEYKGKYWIGNGFGKKEKAKSFPSLDDAWKFIEGNFNHHMWEQFGVQRKG